MSRKTEILLNILLIIGSLTAIVSMDGGKWLSRLWTLPPATSDCGIYLRVRDGKLDDGITSTLSNTRAADPLLACK